MKKLVAITGGIGSGKSSVLHYLSNMGYPIFSCDEIYREVILSANYIEKIREAFPECISKGKINKKTLADIVFKNKENLDLLNGIAHPLIMENLFTKMRICEGELVFAEVPLLFEGNFEKQFDVVIVIMRNKEERIRSIMDRDNISKQEAIDRIAVQFDYDNPKKRFESCNAILLENNGTQKDLLLKISNIVKQIL